MSDRPRLPDLALPALGGGAGAPLRARRQGTVLVLLAAPLAARDAEWVRDLAAREAELKEWDGRALVVLEGDGAAASASLGEGALPVPVLIDAKGTLAHAAGVAAPALVITDQYGEVYASAAATGGWMPFDEIVAWLKYLSIRCAG